MNPVSPPAPPLSYLAWSAPARLAVATVVVALLWLAVVWAIG
jgi:hypothetical protein